MVERDVTGFRVPPPRRRPTPSPDAPAPEPDEPATTSADDDPLVAPVPAPRHDPAPKSTGVEPRTRLSVHVPEASAEALRDATVQRGMTQAQLVLDAQADFGQELEQEVRDHIARLGGIPLGTRQRVTAGPSTQLGLSMTVTQAQLVKAAAARCHHTVSAHVTELLDRYL